jgi:hypothetical protein
MATTKQQAVNSVRDIQSSQHANSVCAICLKNGKLTAASAIRKFETWTLFYVCVGHAERARRWDRVVVSYLIRQQLMSMREEVK